MDGDEVGLAQQVVHLDALGGRRVGGGLVEDVVPDQAHVEGGGATGDLAADAAEADDAERLALRVVGERGLRLAPAPCAGAGVGLELHQAAAQHQHQRDGEVGDGVVEHAGGVAERDAVLGQEGDVEGVEADRGGRGDLQVGSGVEQLFVDLDDRVEQDAVGVPAGGDQVGARGAGRDHDDVAGGGELGVEVVFDRDRLDDLGHLRFLPADRERGGRGLRAPVG